MVSIALFYVTQINMQQLNNRVTFMLMQRLQAYKFELRPNGEQQRNMRRFAGSCRFVYNKALALQQERHKAGEKKLGYAALCRALTEWKAQPQTLWLSETPSQALQQALKNLERAYKNFFEKRADFPRFKKKGVSDGVCLIWSECLFLDQ